ncbi:hypothetical protein DSLASN_02950 [Desulfoluna limicola]|uniref:Glycosyltransferase n=2 Tax=Desulfoluna limicola TaxID=2810562 RepID=A0ABM7PBV1_9BACT|nr:hypothetical protein DSLASN_02950 [Desulfoluna limicola]
MSDDYESFSSIPENSKYAEQEIINKADIIFVTAHKLYEKVKLVRNDNVYYLPNGANYSHFCRTSDSQSEPSDIKNLPHPRVIYVGSVADWFDFDTLYHAANRCPDVSFIIIGPSDVNLSHLDKFTNIHMLGGKNYSDIPKYVHFCDAAMIPFKKNKLTDSTNPVKLYEYFSAGLPVVSRNLDEIKRLCSPALLYDTPEEFVDNIQNALTKTKGDPSYYEFAQKNSWDARFSEIISHIEKLI